MDDAFENHRRYLTRLAYRMLGSVGDAEDVVQEAWLRWREIDHGDVADIRAYLARITARLCLDQMKTARRRREFYVGTWLPEPLIEAAGSTGMPDDGIDAPIALMLALERLSPLERAAFLLHDIFEMDFTTVARTIERSEAACRQLAKRAREHVRLDLPRQPPMPAAYAAQFVEAFYRAAHQSDPSQLQALLARDVALHSDGGGKVSAAPAPLFGAERIASFLTGYARKATAHGRSQAQIVPVAIDGMPGYLSIEDGVITQTVALDIADGVVRGIYAVRNPDKLRHLAGFNLSSRP